MSDAVLVTGATGDTGRYTVECLLEKKIPVRALVHREDNRSARLLALGAEVVVGDLLDLDSVRKAVRGTRAAYFVYPILPGLIEATAFFAQAAKEEGLRAIVNMSQLPARSDAKSHASRNHWIAERVLDWSGVPVTHLRPTFFAQWLLYPRYLAMIKNEGVVRVPFGEGRHAPIAAEDQARLIATILLNPEPHQGQIYKLHGPNEMSQREIAALVGGALGREVKYEPITIDAYRSRLEEARFPSYLIQHLSEVALDYQNGIFSGEDQVIARITGEPPMTVSAFVSAHRAEYEAA
ncbi:NmrA family NAD(P)-binding protein [Paraburkholderia sp. 22B1P]|uniref:NmrA family NAD(P)-binding protein n=1 Tax=Paraburkholderia sp. 22B1P TaxID=3080498 RepID=UPI00308808F3|nr:NmrA family NAD(P)-binding protein [Paraburkholderia sp. 22B1P]